MTIASQTSRISYNGDGSTTAFAVPFKFLVNSDLVVYLRDASGNQTLQTLGSNYSVSGAGVDAGGTVTFTLAPPVGVTIVIYRDPPVTQTTSYNNNDPFPAKSHENALDKLTTLIQRLVSRIGRTPSLLESSSFANLTLPDPQAGTYLKWNQTNTGLENSAALTFAPNSYPIATLSEAQGATLNTVLMTPLRTADEISFKLVDQATAETGTNNTGLMTPLRTAQAITARTLTVTNRHRAAPYTAGIHFKCMKGTGFIVGESGAVAYTAAVAAAAGARTVTLNTTPTFIADQLITYVSSDGEYYTAGVKGAAGAVVTFKQPLEASIPAGNAVNNFWGDEIHPSTAGYNAVVDYSLREARTIKRLAYKWVAGDSYVAIGSPTQSSNNALSYNNPGSTTTPSQKFVATVVNDGMRTQSIYLPAGNYIARVAFCANTEAGSADTASTSVNIVDNGVLTSFSASSTSRCAETLDVPFAARSGKAIQIWVTSNVIGAGFAVGQIEIFEVLEFVPDINYGRHVVLGDSYVQNGAPNARLAARLPNATVINAGVSGDRTSMMLARFQTDVTPQKPDFVWIVAEGANDYAGAIAADTYDSNVSQMISATAGARADCVVIGAGIGPKAHSTLGDLLTASRNYVLNTRTGPQATSLDSAAWIAYTPTVTAASGTFTTVSATGRFKMVGKTMFVQMAIIITTVGTASGIVFATLPAPAATGFSYCLSGSLSTGPQLGTSLSGGAVNISKYDGTTAIASGVTLIVSGSYETA